MNTEHDLLALAHGAGSLARFREAALDLLRGALDAEVGLFVTLADRDAAPAVRGLDAVSNARLDARWNVYAPEVAPVQAAAGLAGATTDLRTLGAGLRRTRVYREIMAPARGSESLYVVPALAGRKVGFVMLGRCGGRFSDAAVAHARSLAPCLAVACAALASIAPTLPAAPRDVSRTEADLLGYLALGYSSRQIATARGTSFFTVRNQLSALYRKLGVANRTEAVGLRRRRSPPAE
jgi:DNA-binding CsgD family transcriptional regulator